MPQPEGKLVKSIRRMIEKRGGRCFKIHGGDNPFQEVGIPDLLCCYRGRFVGLEVKQLGEEPSPVQRVVLHEIVAAGGYASVVATVKSAEHLLADIDKEADNFPRSRAASVQHRQLLLDRSIVRASGK
jgi:hypothetical protein